MFKRGGDERGAVDFFKEGRGRELVIFMNKWGGVKYFFPEIT